MSLTSKRIYEFGEFRLKVGARVLERNGEPVVLGSKAFEVLTCLVIDAGQLVTKDKLLKTVWPESFVEEGNLSQHVFALRKALGNRSGFIVTVPGRGYQFTATVREVPELPVGAPGEAGSFLLQRTRERTHIVIEETSQVESDAASEAERAIPAVAPEARAVISQQAGAGGSAILRSVRPGMEVAGRDASSVGGSLWVEDAEQGGSRSGLRELPEPPRRKRGSVWTAIAVGIVILPAGWFALRRYVLKAPVSQRVVIAEFENRTQDPGFDDVLRDALEIDLDQSPYIDVMGESEALNTLRLMGRSPGTAFAPAIAREVCQRSNRQVLITGSVASVGQSYLLTLEATDCESGKILAGAKAEAASKEQTLAALDSASAKLRKALGESAESLQRFQVPIAQATTSSLEALQQYSIGEYLLGRIGKEESEVLPFFQRAVELDPQFAMAQAAMATGYYSLGENKLADPYYEKAFDLSGQVSEKERLYIRAHYYSDDKKDVRQGLEVYRMWAETYPRDWGPWINIANEYAQLGEYAPAIHAAEEALKLDSSRGIIYSVLAQEYMHVDRDADAESTAKRALSIGKDSNLLHETLFELALLANDRAAMDREISLSHGRQGEWDFLDLQAMAAAKDGLYNRAAELFQTAYKSAVSEKLPEEADNILMDEASADFDLGMNAAARAALGRISPANADSLKAAFVRAELGDDSGAMRSLAVHAGESGQDTLMTSVDEPRIRARMALSEGKPLQAIAELQSVGDYEFAAGYVVPMERGDAYLMARQAEPAAVEYREVLDHPGVDPVSPLAHLARLGLARAELQAGRIQQSKADYEKLLAQWREADSNLPMLLTARREYASLRPAD